MPRDCLFKPSLPLRNRILSQFVRVWNSTRPNKINVFDVEKDESSHPLQDCEGGETPKAIYVRLSADRWEGYGYFQESVLSAIEPVPNAGKLANPLPAETVPTDEEPIESMVEYIRETSDGYLDFIEMLSLYTGFFGVLRNQFLRPNVNKFIDKQAELMDLAYTITDDVRERFTEADRLTCFAKYEEHVKKKREEDAKQKANEAVKPEENGVVEPERNEDIKQKDAGYTEQEEEEGANQKEDEDAKQESEENVEETPPKDNKQEQNAQAKGEDDEAVKQKECEDDEQKEREKAKAIIAAYAEQDRYDSCSDSDEE
jgi:hypothetical protein